MQRLILAAAVCMSAVPAGASSIEPYTPSQNTKTSIVEIGCPACAREAAEKAAAEAEVRLAPGEQIVEAREVDGEMMIYRTENLLGGSPVTMVRKASEADLIALGIANPDGSQTAAIEGGEAEQVAEGADGEPKLFEPVIANTSPGVDAETKTSALSDAPAAEFDPSKFELRLN